MPKYLALLLCILLAACSDNNNDHVLPQPEPTPPDFSAADSWLQDFVDSEEAFTGTSIALVDKRDGTIHKATFGDHSEDTVVLLASASKVPSVTLLMALHDDNANVDFEIDAPIANYLPWQGVWDQAITTEHLVSNRSGIPGLAVLFTNPAAYGAHLCQYAPVGTLLGCAQAIYETALPTLETQPVNSTFIYGGSQWQLSGAVAETVGGSGWQQLWDTYIGQPCGMEVFRYGNNLSTPTTWDGNPDGLLGLDNPNIEGGAISDLDDYAKLISMHLNGGACGDSQVLSQEAIDFMRLERTPAVDDDWGYGMGWWIIPPQDGGSIYLYVDPGFYGSISWIDIEREYGGVVFFEEYTGTVSSTGSQGVVNQLIPLIEAAIDAVR